MLKSIAPIKSRLIAFLIDWSLFTILTLISFNQIATAKSIEILLNNSLEILIILLIIPTIIQSVQSYMTYKFGGSIGKLICGIIVIDQYGKNLSIPMSFFRTFIGPLIASPLLGLGYIWIFLDKNHQGWHDLAIGTTVVESKASGLSSGIITLILCVFINLMLIFLIVSNISSNQYIYMNILKDISQQMEKQNKTEKTYPTPTVLPRIY
jgi:uncharacterized RDD family membrane protein YckC